MTIARLSLTALAVVTGLACVTSTASAASFNCKKARTATEKAICGSRSLSGTDSEMARLYKQVLGYAASPARVRRDQKAWLKQRNSCGASIPCIGQAYHERISELEFEPAGE